MRTGGEEVPVAYGKVRDEYAAWLAAPKKTKLAMGLPQTQKHFAELNGVTPRTLQRWKKDAEFQLLVEQKKARMDIPESTGRPRPYTDARSKSRLQAALDKAAGEVPELPEGESTEETEYLRVKQTVLAKAMDGDHRAQEIYMKHWGRSWVDAEASADEELGGLTDDELVDRMLSLVGAEQVAAWLAEQS